MDSPTVTDDLRLVGLPAGRPLTGTEALELGKKLLAQGCIKIALETVERNSRSQRGPAEEA